MFVHETKIRVRYGETDQMGYLYYGYYALYYEQGRGDAMRSLGFTYKELEEQGTIMPVASMHCEYLRPAHYDDLITVKTILKELPDGHFTTFHSELYNEAGKLINRGSVTLAFFDPLAKRKTKLPEVLRNVLAPYFKNEP
ncbi:thioesterase [Taibaiella sp. KBW10]|uniref:acyl-CoA thioesterase n=1 Tax=Taibaiella sp. KBW10 TaxID=2153357 RepID=UPI000F5B4DA0|nr:thioesterase family protein [Taibaiella sp. KBW10]RQO30802.1 thioesterase [Taibaiella sp. KBW10]